MEQPVPRLERNTDTSGVRKQHPHLQGPGVQVSCDCGLEVQQVLRAGWTPHCLITQFPLLGKYLFPVTSAFSALEKLSYWIQILACLNSHPGSGMKGCMLPRYRRTNDPNSSCSLNKFKIYWTKSCTCNKRTPGLHCPTKKWDTGKAKSAQK